MKQYLLGELTEPEQQELEERLMTSDEYFERLLIVEDELVDEYLQGTLSPREQEKFNDHFLCTPQRREKLRFSKSLQRYVSAHAEKPRTVWGWLLSLSFLRASYVIRGWSMVTALFLLVLGGSWLTVRTQLLQQALEQVRKQEMIPAAGQQELQQQLAQLRGLNDQLASQLERRDKHSAALEQELATLKASPPQRSSLSMVAFALKPGGVRGTQGIQGMQKMTIPVGANWVQLQLDLGTADYHRYRMVLQKVEGEEISTQITPKIKTGDDTDIVVLTVPAKLLTHGDYILKLSGMDANGNFEDVSRYSFRALRK